MTTEMPNSEATQSAGAPLAEPAAVKGRTRGDDTSLLDLLVILAERKRLILLITAAFTVVGIVVSLLMPVRYTATVTLLPPQQNSSMGAALASQLGNLGNVAALAGGSLGLKNPNDMYVAMLQSRTVEDA
ncbi:MAG: Wzz/FepE/Etk N-terminal domain-containing protein, partial [Terracidiphilus sp.]